VSNRWDDLLSETPSNDHARKVMDAVSPVLAEARKRDRRKLFAWIWTAGLGTACAGAFAAVMITRQRQATPTANDDATLAVLDELDPTAEGGEDLELIAAETQELDFDLLAQLDELSELNDGDLNV
jgi:hypothetical protein